MARVLFDVRRWENQMQMEEKTFHSTVLCLFNKA